tara:strand:+ start:241 stop:516 length:276 start_codon:yes stop_codon:yes gene_type:complete
MRSKALCRERDREDNYRRQADIFQRGNDQYFLHSCMLLLVAGTIHPSGSSVGMCPWGKGQRIKELLVCGEWAVERVKIGGFTDISLRFKHE